MRETVQAQLSSRDDAIAWVEPEAEEAAGRAALGGAVRLLRGVAHELNTVRAA